MTIYQLKRIIEDTRKSMNEAAAKTSLHDPEVIRLSVTLDRLLNEYQNHKKSANTLGEKTQRTMGAASIVSGGSPVKVALSRSQ